VAKVRAAIERDDFRSADLKKLSGSRYFRLKLDYDARLLVSFAEHRGKRACLALEHAAPRRPGLSPLLGNVLAAPGQGRDRAGLA
jgi:hypothetical protein